MGSCRLSTSGCCRWWNSTWKCSAFSTVRCLRFPGRLSKCPSCLFLYVLFSARFRSNRRWRNSCWKCRRRSTSSSRTPTVLCGRGARGGLQGFPPEQGSAASFLEQIVDIPVHSGGLRGFLRRQSSTAPSPQTADIPSSGFLPEQHSTARFVDRTLILQFRVVVAEVVEVFKIFAHNRVQQRRLRRSLTFLPVEVLTVFSPGKVPQRLSMLNFRLAEVFTVYAQARVFLRFLDLNTAMMLPGVHAEVEDLLEVLKAPSQDRAQQPEVELVTAGFAGCFFILPSAAGCGFIDSDAVAEFGDAACLEAGALRRTARS